MRKAKLLKTFLILSILEGCGVVLALLGQRSEDALFLGYSLERCILLAAVGSILTLLTILLVRIITAPAWTEVLWSWLDRRLDKDQYLFGAFLTLAGLGLFSLGGWLFSYLSIPATLRWLLFWAAGIFYQLAIMLGIAYSGRLRSGGFTRLLQVFPRWSYLDATQKKTFWLLFTIGVVYFLAFLIPNALDAMDEHMLYLRGGDENITYPYVVWMLTPGERFETTVYRFFIYEDYHYGYPFYFVSMLALLPVRLIAGAEFGKLTQLNLLLLRQLVSVLPMILSAGVLAYLQTRFKARARSAAIFTALLLLGGMVQYNMRFWHPDALVVLCVAMMVFFLDRDRFSFRHNFLLAAFFCGLASAIKLFGFFFFLTIAVYLLVGLARKQLTIRRSLIGSAGFLAVMVGTLIFANPFLFVPDARARMLEIMEEKSGEVREGYNEPDPEGVYEKGLAATLPHLKRPYGQWFVLLFLLVSIASAAVWGENRLVNGAILGWVLVSAFYLIFFSAIKNYHYWLPTMIPLFSGFFGLAEIANPLREWLGAGRAARVRQIALAAGWLVLVFQIGWSVRNIGSLWLEWGRIAEIFAFSG